MEDYVEKREGHYFILGSRVSLDSIVYGFLNGESPETIRENFPTLNLAQVYAAITYYLERQADIDRYLKAKQESFDEARRSQAHVSDDLRARLTRRRTALNRRS